MTATRRHAGRIQRDVKLYINVLVIKFLTDLSCALSILKQSEVYIEAKANSRHYYWLHFLSRSLALLQCLTADWRWFLWALTLSKNNHSSITGTKPTITLSRRKFAHWNHNIKKSSPKYSLHHYSEAVLQTFKLSQVLLLSFRTQFGYKPASFFPLRGLY